MNTNNSLKQLNKNKMYTADQLKTLAKFKNKFLDVYPHHYEYRNDKTCKYETVYEIRGMSNTVKENFQTVDEILN